MSRPPSRHHVYVIKKIVVDSELTESADQKYGSLAAKEKIKSQPHSQTLFVILGMRLTRQSEKIQVERQEGSRKQDISEVCIFSTCSTNNNYKEKSRKRRRMGKIELKPLFTDKILVPWEMRSFIL